MPLAPLASIDPVGGALVVAGAVARGFAAALVAPVIAARGDLSR